MYVYYTSQTLFSFSFRYPAADHPEFALPESIPLFCLPSGVPVERWEKHTPFPLPTFSTFALTNAQGQCVSEGERERDRERKREREWERDIPVPQPEIFMWRKFLPFPPPPLMGEFLSCDFLSHFLSIGENLKYIMYVSNIKGRCVRRNVCPTKISAVWYYQHTHTHAHTHTHTHTHTQHSHCRCMEQWCRSMSHWLNTVALTTWEKP